MQTNTHTQTYYQIAHKRKNFNVRCKNEPLKARGFLAIEPSSTPSSGTRSKEVVRVTKILFVRLLITV